MAAMNAPAVRPFIALTLLALACSSPGIKGTGGNGAGGSSAGNGAGGNGAGGTGAGGSRTDGPSLGNIYPEAGAAGMPGGSDAGPSSGPQCAAETIDGKMVPLDLMLLVDISGSMEESAGAQSKWVAMRDAFDLFLKDPKSVGLGVGLMTFPPPPKKCTGNPDCGGGLIVCEQKGMCSPPATVATTEAACNAVTGTGCPIGDLNPCTQYGICSRSGLRCTAMGQACGGMAGDMCMPRPKFCAGDESCGAALYAQPIVQIADLPGAQAGLSTALAGIVPQGGTPTTPAVRGALDQLRARAMANPDRKPVLVLATDGLPTGCFPNSADTVATALTMARTGMPSILTYVIGVFQPAQLARSRPALEMMATAGGSGMPFVLTTGADLSMRFLNAISQIRGTALGCEFTTAPAASRISATWRAWTAAILRAAAGTTTSSPPWGPPRACASARRAATR
jgi:hypothetical protein